MTGGAGYIGSHTYVALKAAGYDVVILDNFSNAHHDVIDRLEVITGAPVPVYEGDVLDPAILRKIFTEHEIAGAVHFAAKKAVGESTEIPLDYIETNVSGLVTLLKEMRAAGVFRIVFSSSATVYGEADVVPTPEDSPRSYSSPYAFTKLASEQILEQVAAADDRWAIGILRYFNPAGAHPTGLIGEDPDGIPNNLMPYIAKVAMGDLERLSVFGDDYPTPDGTGVRDYIHVEDLARGHVLSIDALTQTGDSHTVNLGTGQGYSVFDMLKSYERACGQDLAFTVTPRRAGDVPYYIANPDKAKDVLGFAAEMGLDDMCASSWNWISRRKNS
nr:UDP-glucose 4-epimerase GalE [Aliiroseovarius subalbicans]